VRSFLNPPRTATQRGRRPGRQRPRGRVRPMGRVNPPGNGSKPLLAHLGGWGGGGGRWCRFFGQQAGRSALVRRLFSLQGWEGVTGAGDLCRRQAAKRGGGAPSIIFKSNGGIDRHSVASAAGAGWPGLRHPKRD